jgi:hypothetical protein
LTRNTKIKTRIIMNKSKFNTFFPREASFGGDRVARSSLALNTSSSPECYNRRRTINNKQKIDWKEKKVKIIPVQRAQARPASPHLHCSLHKRLKLIGKNIKCNKK